MFIQELNAREEKSVKPLRIRLAVYVSVAICVGVPIWPVWAAAQAPASPMGQRPALQAAEQRPAELTIKQRRELNRLIAQFRRARNDPGKRARYVEQAIALGEPAVSALFELIVREMHPQLKRYRNLLYKETVIRCEERIGKADLGEIVQLRGTVLGLSKGPNFTKEAIVARADPAIKRLEEIFLVDRSEVLARSKKLQAEREKLHAPGALWERCAVYLHGALPDDENKPKRPPSFEAYLRGEEELAARLAAPMDASARAVIARNAAVASRLDPEEARAILALNLTRNLLGLPPLAVDLKLVAAARDHSNDMRTLGFFSHNSPVPGKQSCRDRAKRFGTTASSENIFRGGHDGKAANLAWFHSPGHHKNMLGKHKRVGVGRAGVYFTQTFGD